MVGVWGGGGIRVVGVRGGRGWWGYNSDGV